MVELAMVRSKGKEDSVYCYLDTISRPTIDPIRENDPPCIDEASPAESLLLYKPTHADKHCGGERIKIDTWQFHLIRRWLDAGSRGPASDHPKLAKLEIVPNEILFCANIDIDSREVRAKATWGVGTVEDVTPLCRYQVNIESIATVDADEK